MSPNQERCLWARDHPTEREEMASRDPSTQPFPFVQPSLSLTPTLPLHYLFAQQGLVDGETPVVVHGEQDGFACVVEPGGSSHVHSPLPGGHDRCDCVPCHRGNRLVSGPTCSAGLARAARTAQLCRRAGQRKECTQDRLGRCDDAGQSFPGLYPFPGWGKKGSQVGPLQGLAGLSCAQPLLHLQGWLLTPHQWSFGDQTVSSSFP